jgi:putative transposase
MPDHIHLLLSIPPKFSVSNTVGFIKGKSAIRIHLELLGIKRDSRAKLLGDWLLCEHSRLG